MVASPSAEKPIASFVLSLMAGILILGGSGVMMTLSGLPYYGGMMGGRYGMMGWYYGMMQGFTGGWFYVLAALGIASGIVIIIGSIMIYSQPAKSSAWGVLILALSIVSLFGMGGFFLGAILGIVGGVLAITWKA